MDAGRSGGSRGEHATGNGRPHILICPVIAGPTAAGKTALVLGLAAEFPIEVVSLDSRQIYRGLRIGTAQPSPEEMAACKHHLVDFLEPQMRYSAQLFRQDFESLWPQITARGRLPVLVGGAGLYLRAVTEGFFDLPAGSDHRLAAVRDEVAALSDTELDEALRREDPVSARSLHPNDRYRRSRALEIFRLAGRPAGELAAQQRPQPAMGLNFPVVILKRPRTDIDRRIWARAEAMLRTGWIEETACLLTRHRHDCPGLKSLGYAEIVRYLRDELPRNALFEAIVMATRQYAKRQRTWFAKVHAMAAGVPEDSDLREVLRRNVRQGLDLLEAADSVP